MGLAEEIQRVRMRARGSEINARHRRAREQAQQMKAAMGAVTPIDGVNEAFAARLDQARLKAKAAADRRDAQPQDPNGRIEQLVREGKLPPRPGAPGVAYEPTPEEILGDLAGASPPEGTEDLPDAAAVLAGDAPAASGQWGEPPAPAAAGAPGAPASGPQHTAPLAPGAGSVQSKRKRGK